MTKKYKVALKYQGYPKFTIETEANSDEEAILNAQKKVLQQMPNLKTQEIVLQMIMSSNAPY